jgi:D-alanine--poly(phosphoribitol) ligase subunit 1
MQYSLTVAQRLLRSAEAHASRPAVWLDGRHISYATLFAHASGVASLMNERLAPDAPVGILCQRSFPALVGVLAAVLSGRPYVPLNPGFPKDRHAMMIAAARPPAIVYDHDTHDLAGQLQPLLGKSGLLIGPDASSPLGLRDERSAIRPAPLRPQEISTGDTTLYLMFTSGTTGVPKGVRVLDRNVSAYLDGIGEIVQLTPEDRCSHLFDLSFDLSVHDLLVTWTEGAELFVLPKTSAMETVTFARENELTTWFSVPSTAAFATRLGQVNPGALPSLRLSIFCGEPLPVRLARRWAECAPNAALWNLYGPTEATIALTAYQLRKRADLGDLVTVPLGQPLAGQQVCVVGKNGAAIEAGEEGELLLGGSQVTPGYINNPDANAAKFSEDVRQGARTRWYRTGDLVALTSAHGMVFRSRVDDQVKINGYRVELLEIDDVLRSAAEIHQVAALPWPVTDAGTSDQIIAFVCGSSVEPAEIRKRCRACLPAYMVPRRVMIIDQMPLNSSGKIDRHALRSLLAREA